MIITILLYQKKLFYIKKTAIFFKTLKIEILHMYYIEKYLVKNNKLK